MADGFEIQSGRENYDAAVVSLREDGSDGCVVMHVDFDPDQPEAARQVLDAMVEMANFAITVAGKG